MKNLLFAFSLLSTSAFSGDFSLRQMIDEDFSNGKALDAGAWTRVVGPNTFTSVYYTEGDKNISYENGVLVLEARKEHVDNPKYNVRSAGVISEIKSRGITSASIATKEYFKYGRVEVVAKLPEVPGLQPAIWLQGKNAGQYGEIDLVEIPGAIRPGFRYATIHAGASPSKLERKGASRNLGDGFHKYAADWNSEGAIIYFDGEEVLRVPASFGGDGKISPLNQPMQLKINIGGGTKWSGPVNTDHLPQKMEVKSIKIWTLESS